MKKYKNIIRFAVGSQMNLRSSIWRLWSNKNDLYLAARSFAHISKISFHQSGKYRYAINEKIEKENASSDRALLKWNRPSDHVPGWTMCFGIIIPPRVTTKPFVSTLKNEDIILINPPGPEEKLIFNIILSSKSSTREQLIKGSPHKITIHGCIEMNKELAWLISFPEKFTSDERIIVMNYFNKLKLNVAPNKDVSNLNNAFLHAIKLEPHACLTDIELGHENLNFS